MIQAVIKNPGQDPIVVKIDPSLESLQRFVGGYIEVLHTSNLDLIVNEEGLMINLPFNTYVNGIPLVGTIIAVGHDDEGETIGLTDAQVSMAMNLLSDDSGE